MATGTLELKIRTDDGETALTVAKVAATIGSADHCDVCVVHPTVHDDHARLWVDGGRLWLQDLGGTAGTFLNETRLPALKPMLVRPLDRLTLGECPHVITFAKSNFARPEVGGAAMRAPRVREAGTFNDVSLTDARPAPAPLGAPTAPVAPAAAPEPSSESREERGRLARELAELRLQLQMAQLEKTGVDDLRKVVNDLRGEVRALEDQRRETKVEIERAREVEQKRAAAAAAQLVTLRADAEREIEEMRDMRGRALGHWKIDVVTELNAQVHGLLLEKARAWVTRPLSNDMMLELEGEMGVMFRDLLLEEDPHGGSAGDVTRGTPARLPAVGAPTGYPPTDSHFRMALGGTVARRPNTYGRRVMVTGLIVATLAFGMETYRKQRGLGSFVSTRAPAAAGKAVVASKPVVPDDGLYGAAYGKVLASPEWRRTLGAEVLKHAAAFKLDTNQLNAFIDRDVQFARDSRAMFDRAPVDATIRQLRAREVEFNKIQLGALRGDQSALTVYASAKRSALLRLLPH